jgi:ABC-type uncharacterized transport system ATPase subunit
MASDAPTQTAMSRLAPRLVALAVPITAVIAREFSSSSDALVVAQPTRGVDIGAAEYIHERLLEQRSNGAAILLISEDLDEVMQLSDRIIVVLEGEIMGEVARSDATVNGIGLLMTGVTE